MSLVAKAFTQKIQAANPRPSISNNRALPKIGLAGNRPVNKTNSQVGIGQNKAVEKKAGVAPVAGANAGTPASASSSPSPAAVAFNGPVDPRDASYWEQKAQLEYAKRIDEEAVNAANQRSEIQKNEELAERDYYDPREQQEVRKNSNSGGLIYSTTNQERQGELGVQQAKQRTGIGRAYQEGLEARAAGLRERQSGRAQEERQFYQEAVERAAMNEANRAAFEEQFVPNLDFSGLENIMSGNISIGGGNRPRTSPSTIATKKHPIAAKAFGKLWG